MRNLTFLIVVITCTVIGGAWAQNRGSARYVQPEDFEGDVTRGPRPSPTRGSRRQRPVAAPEPALAEDELKPYQPPETSIRTGTTARRVPQRGRPQQVAPSPPIVPEEPIPLYPAPVEELPQPPSVENENRQQGKRRRRPKKRRRPQAASAAEELEKDVLSVPEKVAGPELVTDERKQTDEFPNNPQSRNAPSDINSDPSFQPEKSSWAAHGNIPPEQPQSNGAGSQYFRPQPSANRLPVENSEPIDNSRRYIEPSPILPNAPDADAYAVPKRHPIGISNEASYVPVLNPIRVPSDGSSRLPPEDFPAIRNQDSTRQTPDHIPSRRPHDNTFSVPDPNEIILNTGAKPIQNTIPQPNEPSIPVRGNSEIRLPPVESPLLSPEYIPSNVDPREDSVRPLEPNHKVIDETDKSNPSNRLPNPSEIHYDSVYPEYSDTHSGDSRRYAGRRQETPEIAERNPLPSYTSPRRNSGTKPQEYDNDAAVDRRQLSQYQPPLQRSGSRYKTDDSDNSPSHRSQEPPSTSVPRSRGSSRYQTPDIPPERTRSSARHSSESSSDSSSRTRGSQTSLPKESNPRTRGSQRYVPDITDNAPRQNTRRQQSRAEPLPRDTGYTPSAPAYVPVDEIINAEQRAPSNSARTVQQPPENLRSENEPEDYEPARYALRPRPQYEGRGAEPEHSYDESAEDAYSYNPNYAPPREPSTRTQTSERTPVLRQNSRPEYESPPNRQNNRQESHHGPQQAPQSRHQPQYQAPQNPRGDSRQANSRSQSRPKQQEPEPPTSRSRSSSESKFKCPEPFGFFGDPVQCDKYYECRNGTVEVNLCNDGLAFNEISAPKYLRCDSLRDVDCKSRPELQEPQPTQNCPRRFGLFAHETDCTKFWNCVDGAATEVQCPPGLTYNDEKATCDWADLVEESCKSEDLLGFSCPEATSHEMLDGVYSRYPHPKNCQLHYTCIKGADGHRRPRMLSCNEGLVFDPETGTCARPENVPGCEDFYGGRSEAPKRKPASKPIPIEPEEESIEEPTPRPRRRGSNRRSRN